MINEYTPHRIKAIAHDYAKQAFELALEQDDLDSAVDYLNETIDGCEEVIYYNRAWNVVYGAREDSQLYDAGHDLLCELGLNTVAQEELLDSLMCRLAYCILEAEALNVLQDLVTEHDEQNGE